MRVFRSADAVYTAKRLKKTARDNGSYTASPGSMSGMALAGALGGTGSALPNADTNALLTVADCSKMPCHMQAEHSLWDALQDHTTKAKTQGKVAFAFVDLTDKAVLPIWIPVEPICGKFSFQGGSSEQLEASANVGTLNELSKALKGATANSRFSRTTAQWVAAFDR